jgi:hypothetical protein
MPYMLIMPPPPPLPRLAVRSKATPNLSVSSDSPLRLCVTPASSRVARVSLYSTRYSLQQQQQQQQQQQHVVCQCLSNVKAVAMHYRVFVQVQVNVQMQMPTRVMVY